MLRDKHNSQHSIFSLCLTSQHGYRHISQKQRQLFTILAGLYCRKVVNLIYSKTEEAFLKLKKFFSPNLKEETILSSKSIWHAYVLTIVES